MFDELTIRIELAAVAGLARFAEEVAAAISFRQCSHLLLVPVGFQRGSVDRSSQPAMRPEAHLG